MEQKTKGITSMATAKLTSESLTTSKPERLAPKGRPKALTNREYFAGVGLTFFMEHNYAVWDMERIKKEAYLLADLMIEE